MDRLTKMSFIFSFVCNVLFTLFLFCLMNAGKSRNDVTKCDGGAQNSSFTQVKTQNSVFTQGQPGKQGPKGEQGPPGPIGSKGDPAPLDTSYLNVYNNKTTKNQPCVHLTGYSTNHILSEVPAEGMVPLGIWTTSLVGHSTPGMFSKNSQTASHIHILETGKYFIYCQIYYQIPSKPPAGYFQTYVVFYVVRESSENTILMRSIHSNGLAGKKVGYYTLYTSGVHVLDEGDALYVAVQKEQRGYINYGDTTSYFGAFKI